MGRCVTPLDRIVIRWNTGVISRAEVASHVYDLIEEILDQVPNDVGEYVLHRVIDLLVARRDGVPHIRIGSNLKEET